MSPAKASGRDTRPPAMPPDSLVHVGERLMAQPIIQILDYTENGVAEYFPTDPLECLQLENKDSPAWIRVTGLHDAELVRVILTEYQVHPLLHQDVLNTTHPPKLEEYDDHLFITAKLVNETGETQHMAFLLTERVLFTFQESPSSVFDPVIQRLKDGKGRLRSQKVDYLLWALLDASMDSFLEVLGTLEDRVVDFEEQLIHPKLPDPTLQQLHSIRTDSMKIYRTLRPMREMVSRLLRLESPLIGPAMLPYLRDLVDHAWHGAEMADHLNDNITALRELHQSFLAQRMNEVMKVLAAISTLFLPLTFIAGVYGMNFDYLPELHWKYGYAGVWMVFIALSAFMLWYFRKRKWL